MSNKTKFSELVSFKHAFGRYLKAFRAVHDMKQSDLSRKSGISHITIGKYERGETLPRIDNILAILSVFGHDLQAMGIWVKEIGTIIANEQARSSKEEALKQAAFYQDKK